VEASSVGVETATVSAGTMVGFTVQDLTFHSGVLNVYMARAPGKVADFDGSGSVWFKIYEIQPVLDGGNSIVFPTLGKHLVFTLSRGKIG
jgi:hypothetical protein